MKLLIALFVLLFSTISFAENKPVKLDTLTIKYIGLRNDCPLVDITLNGQTTTLGLRQGETFLNLLFVDPAKIKTTQLDTVKPVKK